jgi:uncharacterized membrane protein (UPF0127 family)
MKLPIWIRLVAAGSVMTAGCQPDTDHAVADAPVMSFDTARVRLVTATDTLKLTVELARTQEQRTMGLMERPRLADSAGMIFLYGDTQPATAAFWMFRTLIPLDIAFVDSTGVIRAILRMVPCEAATVQRCPTYPPGVPYRAALEVNAGYFERNKVSVGHRVVLADTAR